MLVVVVVAVVEIVVVVVVMTLSIEPSLYMRSCADVHDHTPPTKSLLPHERERNMRKQCKLKSARHNLNRLTLQHPTVPAWARCVQSPARAIQTLQTVPAGT